LSREEDDICKGVGKMETKEQIGKRGRDLCQFWLISHRKSCELGIPNTEIKFPFVPLFSY